MPTELREEEGHVYRVETDAQGRESYILLSESNLEMMGQPGPSPRHWVRHKHGDKIDNRRANLEWRLQMIGQSPSTN